MQLKMINFSEFFSYKHLFLPTTEPMRYPIYFFVVFGLAIISSVILYFIAKQKPVKFQKNFFRRVGDSLFYIPILSILYLFIRRAQVEPGSQRAILLSLVIIWLISLIFLVYYRLAVVRKLYFELSKKKREENYLRHGKSKR